MLGISGSTRAKVFTRDANNNGVCPARSRGRAAFVRQKGSSADAAQRLRRYTRWRDTSVPRPPRGFPLIVDDASIRHSVRGGVNRAPCGWADPSFRHEGTGGGQKQLIGHKPEEGSSLKLKLSLHITSCVLMLPSDRWPAMCQTAPESADGGKNVAFSSAATSAPFVTWERRPTETRWGVVSLFEDPICRRGGRKDVFPFPRSPLCTSMATTGSTSIQEIWCRKGRPYFEYSSDSSTATKTGSSTL